MVSGKTKIVALGALVFLGIVLAIPTSLTSLVVSGVASVAIVAVVIGSMLR